MKNTFVCEANERHFHLFEGEKEGKTLEPEFTHQVFREDETIYGYSEDLSVDVLCAPNTFERDSWTSRTGKSAIEFESGG